MKHTSNMSQDGTVLDDFQETYVVDEVFWHCEPDNRAMIELFCGDDLGYHRITALFAKTIKALCLITLFWQGRELIRDVYDRVINRGFVDNKDRQPGTARYAHKASGALLIVDLG